MKFARDNFNAAGASCGANGFDVPRRSTARKLDEIAPSHRPPPRIAPHA
jgi:hypothetical protein